MKRNEAKQNETDLQEYMDGRRSTTGFTKEGFQPSVRPLGSDESVARMRVRGANVYLRGFGVEPTLVPRLSRPDYGHMVYVTGTSYYEEIEALLTKFCGRGSKQWHDYFAMHVAKRTQRADGKGDYQVVKNVEPPYVPPGERSWSERQSKNEGRKVKKYTLSQIFVDTYLQDKYGLPAKLRRDMQLVAITRPADAAATLQEALQALSPGVRIVVSAAGYDNTRQQAAAAIRSMARGKRPHQAAVRSDVIGWQLLMYGPEGEKDWFVSGPLRNADVIADVHNLVCHAGMHETMFLFSIETQILGIEISDGKHLISPTLIGHVKTLGEDLPAESHPDAVEALTPFALERLREVVVNIRVVEGREGMLASAVQIDPRMVLLNNHVKQYDATATVAGNEIDGGVPVSQDLWMQRVKGDYEPWNYRSADIGEMVAILYHNGERPVLSAPFRVDKRSGLNVYSSRTNEVVSGMSGGALVSLRDMALLGLHCGTTLRHLFAVEFTAAMHLDLVEMVSDEAQGRQAHKESADAVLSQLRSRGCHKQFISAVQKLAPLFDTGGSLVGSSVATGGQVFTTAPPNVYRSDGEVLYDFASLNGFVSTAQPVADEAISILPMMREPQLHERVVIVGAGPDGHYVSAETHVRQVGTGKRTFMLTATTGNVLPLTGGLVLSVQDGAVIGMYVRDSSSVTVGNLSLCVPFPSRPSVPTSPVKVLSNVFPMLHVSSWDSAKLGDALRHTSAVSVGGELVPSYRSLAMYGDALMKERLFKRLLDAKTPDVQWTQYFQKLQCNSRLSSLCWDLGLGSLLVTQPGLTLPAQSDAYANMLEAIVALVALHEEGEILDTVLSILGVVPDLDELKGPDAEYGHMMRRPSEFGLPTVTSGNDVRMLTPVD